MSEPGWIYYMRVSGHIKIGYTTDVRRRMANYPPATELLAIEPGSPAIEAARLMEFADDLIWGNEWFRPSLAIEQLVVRLNREHGIPTAFKYVFGKKTPVEEPSREWLPIADAADRLRVSDKTIRRYIAAGLVRAERVGPRLIRVDINSMQTRSLGPGA